VRIAWIAVAATFLAAVPAQPRAAPAVPGGRYFLTPADVASVRSGIRTLPWVREAWKNTEAYADQVLTATPTPADPNLDYSQDAPASPNWRDGVYAPGFVDGNHASDLAIAYLVTGQAKYAAAASRILLAWVEVYSHPPGVGGGVAPGHAVAEPLGPMIKLFMTADMLRGYLSPGQNATVARWAAQWITPAEQDADSARDAPWVPDTTIGSFTTNAAAYGNSPAGQRAMAVWAAAIAGPAQLRAALAWNWSHTTRGGNDFGWLDVIDHMLIPGTGGETIEGRYRASLGYGLLAWSELVLIADLAKQAGYAHDLFTAQTTSGESLLSIAPYYAPLLTGKRPWPLGPEYDGYSLEQSKYLAVFETVYRDCPRGVLVCRFYKGAVNAAGPTARGDEYDPHILRWNALLGVP
jgi:hypothetical protein